MEFTVENDILVLKDVESICLKTPEEDASAMSKILLETIGLLNH